MNVNNEIRPCGARPNAETLARLVGLYRMYADLYGRKLWRREDLLRSLVEVGMVSAGRVANPDTGDTWLHHVCAGVDPRQDIEILLAGSGDVAEAINQRNAAGDTPLHTYLQRPFSRSCAYWPSEAVNLLLAAGADPNLQDGDGKTATDVLAAEELNHSPTARFHRDEVIQYLVAGGAVAPVGQGRWGQSQRCLWGYPLHMAAEEGSCGQIKELLGGGMDVNAEKPDGETPLHAAIIYQHVNCVKMLLNAGARVNAGNNASSSLGVETPIFTAVRMGGLEIVHILLDKGAHIHARNRLGCTLLHVPVIHDHIAIVALLLDNDVDVDVRDASGNTPLHIAAEHSRPDLADFLLSRGADIHARNRLGNTPLHCAMRTWPPRRRTTRIDIVTCLLNAGADSRAQNDRGMTLLHVAAERQDEQVIEFLVTECDGIRDVINRRNTDADAPLHLYLRGKYRPVVAGLTRLLEAGAEPGLRDSKGLSPIDILQARDGADSLHAALIRLLIDYGCPKPEAPAAQNQPRRRPE